MAIQSKWSSLIFTDFQACMYGSSRAYRDKWTRLICSNGLYDDINKQCDGSHAHASWKPSLSKTGAVFLHQVQRSTREACARPWRLRSFDSWCIKGCAFLLKTYNMIQLSLQDTCGNMGRSRFHLCWLNTGLKRTVTLSSSLHTTSLFNSRQNPWKMGVTW